MKIKKLLSAALAAAMALSAMAVTASAEGEYNAKLGFADTAWACQDWDTAVTVTGDGTYTIESTAMAGAADFGVFVIDIEGMYAAAPEASAVLDKIEIDGAEVSFDASKIIYGDIEEKGNFRIEIYNQYGDTKNDSPVAQQGIAESLKLTFTVSGLGGAAAETEAAPAETEAAPAETEAPAVTDTPTESPVTGNAPVAALAAVAVVAAAAVVVSKRR